MYECMNGLACKKNTRNSAKLCAQMPKILQNREYWLELINVTLLLLLFSSCAIPMFLRFWNCDKNLKFCRCIELFSVKPRSERSVNTSTKTSVTFR